MLTQLFIWLDVAKAISAQSNPQVVWNLFLAFIPLIFSLWLFRPSTARSGF